MVDAFLHGDRRQRVDERGADRKSERTAAMRARARAIRAAGGIERRSPRAPCRSWSTPRCRKALVLGLLKQGVRKYLAIFGHGSTDLGEVLRIYEEEGVTRTFNCRNEVAMAHAATALRWQYGEIPAVVTSIGPGAMQAFAGSLAAASNGVGVYHIYGDETTFGEGYNMQQVPKEEQGLFGQMTAIMGRSYVLHTPQALRDALRRGALTVNHPYRAGPFYLLLPLNTQPARAHASISPRCRSGPSLPPLAPAADDADRARPRKLIAGTRKRRHQGRRRHARPRRGGAAPGGSRRRRRGALARLDRRAARRACAEHACRRLEGLDQRQLRHGGSRAADRHRLARGVPGRLLRHRLQEGASTSSTSTAISPTPRTTTARSRSSATSRAVAERLAAQARSRSTGRRQQARLARRLRRQEGRMGRLQARALRGRRRSATRSGSAPALAQPAAIKIVADFAKEIGAAKFFDAGDVQANGFQIVEDDRTGDTFTETGASYMGFAASALLASALADKPRYGIAFCRRRLLHDEPADPDRRRRARRARHDRDLRQPPHGRDHRPAARAIRRRLPHQRRRRGRLRAARRRGRGVNAVHGGWTADELQARARSRARPRRPLGRARAGLLRRRTNSAASAPGANGTSATGARTCSASGSSRICRAAMVHVDRVNCLLYSASAEQLAEAERVDGHRIQCCNRSANTDGLPRGLCASACRDATRQAATREELMVRITRSHRAAPRRSRRASGTDLSSLRWSESTRCLA